MNATLFNSDAGTHLKIIVVALLGALVVVWVSIAAHFRGDDKVIRFQFDLLIETPSSPADRPRNSSLKS